MEKVKINNNIKEDHVTLYKGQACWIDVQGSIEPWSDDLCSTRIDQLLKTL